MALIPDTIKRLLITAAVACLSTACASAAYDTPNSLGVMPLMPPTPIWLGAIGSSSAATIAGAAAVAPGHVQVREASLARLIDTRSSPSTQTDRAPQRL